MKKPFNSFTKLKSYFNGACLFTKQQIINFKRVLKELTQAYSNDIRKISNIHACPFKISKSISRVLELCKAELRNIKFYQSIANLTLNEEEMSMIKERIPSLNDLKLIYSASRDGFGASGLHSLCDNRANTITIITSDYGKKLGGFTPCSWQSFMTSFKMILKLYEESKNYSIYYSNS